MTLNLLTVFSYMLPLTAALISSLIVFQIRQKGKSRSYFGFLMLTISLLFFSEFAMKLDLVVMLPFFYIFFLSTNYLIGPLLFFYNESLLHRKPRFKNQYKVHLFPSLLVFILLTTSFFYIGEDKFGQSILLTSSESYSGMENIFAYLILFLKTTFFYLHLLFYYYLINKNQDRHKKKYGKFYADYEKRNELLLLRIFISILGLIVTQVILELFKADNPYLIIGCNLAAGILIVLIFISGKEQVEIRKYRMYKLSSHEHEIRKK
tara:strand:- start:9944 stop:10735 length:792 start_codon:yes stop_codon:yes gene_type:complete